MLHIMEVMQDFATPPLIMILTNVIQDAMNADNSGSRAHKFLTVVAKYMF